jgi:hypothetical protein
MAKPEIECSWCGGVCDQPRPFYNRRGEVFCSPSHRSSSNRALKRLLTPHEWAQLMKTKEV